MHGSRIECGHPELRFFGFRSECRRKFAERVHGEDAYVFGRVTLHHVSRQDAENGVIEVESPSATDDADVHAIKLVKGSSDIIRLSFTLE